MKLFLQIAVLFGICLVGEVIAKILPFPFPSSVISMILLFLLLLFGILKTEHIEKKADFLLKNMAFFFVPSGVGLMNNYQILKDNIIPFLTVCLVSTLITFVVTGYTVKFVILIQNKCRGGRVDG